MLPLILRYVHGSCDDIRSIYYGHSPFPAITTLTYSILFSLVRVSRSLRGCLMKRCESCTKAGRPKPDRQGAVKISQTWWLLGPQHKRGKLLRRPAPRTRKSSSSETPVGAPGDSHGISHHRHQRLCLHSVRHSHTNYVLIHHILQRHQCSNQSWFPVDCTPSRRPLGWTRPMSYLLPHLRSGYAVDQAILAVRIT